MRENQGVFFRSKPFWMLLPLPFGLLVILQHFAAERPQTPQSLPAPQLLIGDVSVPSSSPGFGFRNFNGVGGLPVPLTALCFSPDGQTLYGSANGMALKWAPEPKKWRVFGSVSGSQLMPGSSAFYPTPTHIAVSADGRRLVLPGAANSFRSDVYDTSSRQKLGNLLSTGWGQTAFSRDGRWLALTELNALALFDLRQTRLDGRLEKDWFGKDRKNKAFSFFVAANGVNAIAFSPDSRSIAVGVGGQLALLDVGIQPQILHNVQKPRLSCDLQGVPMPLTRQKLSQSPNPLRLSWSPDGARLAALSGDEVAIFDAKLHRKALAKLPPAHLISATNSAPGSAAPTAPGGPFLARVAPTRVDDLAWTPDSRTLFSTGDEIRRWRASDLKLQASYGLIGPIAVSPDGKSLLTINLPKTNEPHGMFKWNIP